MSSAPVGILLGVRPQNGGEEVALEFAVTNGENRELRTFVINATDYADGNFNRLQVKEAYDLSLLERLDRFEQINRAVQAGMRLLSYGSNTARALVQKLLRRGYAKEISLLAVGRIQNAGLIDESSDIRRETEKCVSKLWGSVRIRQALYEKGFSKEALSHLPEIFEEIDFPENCKLLLEKWCDTLPSDRKEIQKLVAKLLRYGYKTDEIRQALRMFEEGSD